MRIAYIVLCTLLLTSVASAVEPPATIIDAFLKHIGNDSKLTPEVRTKVTSAVEKHRHDPQTGSAAVMAGLREASPEFAEATQLLANSQWDEGLKALAAFESSADPFLKAEAQFLAGRTLVQRERYEEATRHFLRLETQQDHSLRLAEAAFLNAKSLQGQLKFREAATAYQQFLANYPEANKRLRKEAEAALIDLEDIDSDLLPQIHSKMNFSRRRLGLEDSGQQTQEVQEEVVALLTEMIDELEKKSGKCKGCKCSGNQKPGNPGSKPGQSNVTAGAPQITERDGTKAAWVDAKQRADDPSAFNAAKKKLPAQYKDLIDQYYRSFQNK